jgi:hypothetical protein
MLHDVPFQASAKVPVLLLPTARHSVVDTHETPASERAVELEGFGVASMLHEVPFHPSARVSCVPEPVW